MPPETRTSLLTTTIELMLMRGYAATSVDLICSSAGVTKGTFFHYFPNKEAAGVAALHLYRERTATVIAGAPFTQIRDPLDRVLAYVDFLADFFAQPEVPNACLFGNLSQEVAPVSEALRAACRTGLDGWSAEFAMELEAARTAHPPTVDFTPQSVGRHFVAVYEGALVLSKALGDRAVISDSLRHFRTYLEVLFGRTRADSRVRHTKREKVGT